MKSIIKDIIGYEGYNIPIMYIIYINLLNDNVYYILMY